jgi:hypothetical protein
MSYRYLVFAVVFSIGYPPAYSLTEAFEIGEANKDQLPGGKEADGIVGDYVMRNDLIEAVISCDAPLRKANMGAYWDAVSPGCLYDLTLRGENNDQITIFSPSRQRGEVSYVRIVEDGKNGDAVIEAVVSAESNGGLYKRHEYRLRDGDPGLLIVTTFRNESDAPVKTQTSDDWTRLSGSRPVGEITVADSNDPADKVGYARGRVSFEGSIDPPEELELAPGEEAKVARFLAIGRSPAEAYGVVAARRGNTGTLVGRILDPNGNPVPTAHVEIGLVGTTMDAYPDENGEFRIRLPFGPATVTVRDHGRDEIASEVAISREDEYAANFTLSAASKVAFDIRGVDGKSIPCKAQFIGVDGTAAPNLGPSDRAHGCVDQYHSEKGTFEVQLDPGKFKIVVTRGIEFDHLEKVIELDPGETEKVEGTLTRIVDTAGWVSTDYHNHSTPSGDNVCGTDDRIVNLAAEQIEFAPTTEHNRLYDWTPHIERLGLSDEIATIPGIELTGSGAHFNAFPFEPDPYSQDGGAPVWQKDPRLNAIVLRDFQGEMPERWVHLNHPDMAEDFVDWNKDGREDWGYRGLPMLIDGAECWGDEILSTAPYRIDKGPGGNDTVRYIREFIWLQMLNRGHRYTCIAVSDAHRVYDNGVGGWRTYVPSSTDNPAEIDWKENVRNAKAGQAVISNGPFLEVTTPDGAISGGSTRALGSIALDIEVQCTDWIDVDRIQVLVNGRQREDVNFTRESHPDWFGDGVVKFDRTVEIPLSQDSHLIVVAYGENSDLSIGYGTSPHGRMHPCAYINPIYVDVDGGGFTPNGDTLGFPLPVKGLSVEEVTAAVARARYGDLGPRDARD